ncbi:Uma2 family endonuclease [Runella sp.]|uniref:Uma2 family endonuclease n=1 Tax=Runella sp. TaxID=1960881 RepID=UPI003D111660
MLPAKTRRIIEGPRRVSLEAYFQSEEKALHKHEYHNGIIRPVAGATFNHNRLAQKAANLIDIFIEENNFDYIVNNSDTKIRIEQYDKVVYPDAVVICEKPEFFQNRKDTIINPLLVVEVLSKSTEAIDRTTKYEMYRTLPSFKEYVLIHQDRKHVSVYTKQPDATWIIRDYDNDEATAVLYALHQCPLSLKRLYRGLDM